jgi:hypothetical protein
MKAIHTPLIAATCMLFWACGPKPAATTTTPTDSTAAQVTTPASKEKWLVLKYDDVRLRATPSKGGEVLASFKEGDEVLDLNERSENQETVVLRGESITAAWAKVRSKAGLEGWVFAGTLGAAPDPSVAVFAKSLEDLSTRDCKSIQGALDRFASAMKGKPADVADQAVVPLFASFEKTLDGLNGDLGQRSDTKGLEELFYQETKGKPDPKAVAEKKAWEDCGLQLDYPEGMLYLELKPGMSIPTLDPLVSDAMRRYLEIRKKEDSNPWAADASLLITPKELADRCITWDGFLKDNPEFIFKSKIVAANHNYLGSLLIGENNSSAFDYQSKKLVLPAFKEAWEWVLKTNPKSPTGKVVQEWCDMVKPGGWKMTPKAEKYLSTFLNIEE